MELCRIKKFDSGPCSDDVVFVGYEAPTRRRCQMWVKGCKWPRALPNPRLYLPSATLESQEAHDEIEFTVDPAKTY